MDTATINKLVWYTFFFAEGAECYTPTLLRLRARVSMTINIFSVDIPFAAGLHENKVINKYSIDKTVAFWEMSFGMIVVTTVQQQH